MKTSAPITTVFFSSYSGLGGGETSLRDLLGALDRTRHRPILMTPREGTLPEAVRRLGCETRVVRYRACSVWFVPSVWARLPAVRRIEGLLREISPRVVHSDYHSLPLVLPACRRLGLPLVFTCLGWWFRPRWWQRRFFREGPRAILAISEAVKSGFLGGAPFMDPAEVRVLYLGIDPDRFRPDPGARRAVREQAGLLPETRLVTLLARFQSVKGHELFLDAARRIAARVPAVHFMVAGENEFGVSADESLKRRILRRAKSDPVLRRCVTFLGWVPDPERLLAASDVLVCSSRFESLGLALLEAMACKVPVVSTNVGGPLETVVDGETGFLVPRGRSDLITERVALLLDDEDLRRRMGAAGRIRVQERFQLSRYAQQFADVIETLAAPGRAS